MNKQSLRSDNLSISAVILSKDSQDLISDCLQSVKFCDEIIVVDAISKDKTLEIARKFGAKIINSEPNDYALSRNLGLKAATKDWILYIDTDERVSPQLVREIKKTTKENKFSAFKLKRKNFYFGSHEWPYIEKLERLFRKKDLKGWYGKIHESPQISGKVGTSTSYLLHYTHRDLSSMVVKTMQWSEIEAQMRFRANHPKMTWWRFPRVMATAFFDSYIKQQGFKAGAVGILESLYQSFSIFITYARLWELQRQKK